MRLPELVVLYALIGAGCALVLLLHQRRVRLNRGPTAAGGSLGLVADLLLLLGFWPLYGPFLLIQLQGREPESARSGEGGQEEAFLSVLRQARATPLGSLLPDEATVRSLAQRLRLAGERVLEIEQVLQRLERAEDSAPGGKEPQADSSEYLRSLACLRQQNLLRLRALRDRSAREVAEVRALLAQLATQAEVVRLAGHADASTADLVRELLSRVEGLDQVLGESTS